MKHFPFTICILAFSGSLAFANDEFQETPKLDALRDKFEQEANKILRPLEIKYLTALRNLQEEYQKEGNLEAVLMIKGEADRLERQLKKAAAKTTSSSASVSKSTAPRGRTVNLAELVVIEEDAHPASKWQMNGKLVECTQMHAVPKVYLPYIPPEEYDFRIQWAQPNLRHSVGHLLPNGDGGNYYCGVGPGHARGDKTYVRLDEGQDANYKQHANFTVEANTKHESVLKVRKDGLRFFVDGKLVCEYRGDPNKLVTDVWHRSKKPEQLGIYCDDPTLFSVIEVTEITGKGKILRKK